MQRYLLILTLLFIIFSDAMAKEQTLCPVGKEKIDRKVYSDHAGKRIYFCCPSCIAKFKANPEKYLKEMNDNGVVLAESPLVKPVVEKKSAEVQNETAVPSK